MNGVKNSEPNGWEWFEILLPIPIEKLWLKFTSSKLCVQLGCVTWCYEVLITSESRVEPKVAIRLYTCNSNSFSECEQIEVETESNIRISPAFIQSSKSVAFRWIIKKVKIPGSFCWLKIVDQRNFVHRCVLKTTGVG